MPGISHEGDRHASSAARRSVAGPGQGSDCLEAHNLLGKLAGLDEEERLANHEGHSHDPEADAALAFAGTRLERKVRVTAADVQAVRPAGFDDGQVAEIIAHVALNVLANDFNNAVETPIDFPAVAPLPA